MAYYSSKELVSRATEAAVLRDSTSVKSTLLLAFLAGAYIALGGLLALTVGGGMPGIAAENPGLQKFMMGALFPLGLILCVIAGADLFTGNTAYFIPPLVSGRISFLRLLRNWSLVYFGNFLGALFVAYFLAYKTGLLASAPWHDVTLGLAESKTSARFFRNLCQRHWSQLACSPCCMACLCRSGCERQDPCCMVSRYGLCCHGL